MKQLQILRFLQERRGEAFSAEQIGEAAGLTGEETIAALRILQQGGFGIQQGKNKDWSIIEILDPLTECSIRCFLRPEDAVGDRIDCFDEIDSTNTYAKKIACSGAPDGTVVVADSQTAGRGRKERSFQSPKGKGTYLSILLHPKCRPECLIPVTAMTGVAVCRAVARVCGLRAGLKWPNDPIVGGKKLCGILTENILTEDSQNLIIGIGLNVCQRPEDFSLEVRKMATSVFQETGRLVPRAALAAAQIEEIGRLKRAMRTEDTADYLREFRENCVTLGRRVQLLRPGERETATALGVDEQFGLIIRRDNGETAVIRSGEVSVRGMYGYTD